MVLFMKKISFFLFIFIFSCWALIFAQNNNCRRCKDVIKILLVKNNVENVEKNFQNTADSIVIEFFKTEYEIVNMSLPHSERLLKKNYVEIIQFFSLEENKKYYCKPKHFKYYGPVLLIK